MKNIGPSNLYLTGAAAAFQYNYIGNIGLFFENIGLYRTLDRSKYRNCIGLFNENN